MSRKPVVDRDWPEVQAGIALGEYTVVADEYLTVADYEFHRSDGEWRWENDPKPLRNQFGSAISDDDLVLLVPGYTADAEGRVTTGAVFLGKTPADVTARYQGKTYRLVEVE